MTTSAATNSQEALFESFPELSYWYGLGWSELCDMPDWALRIYERALPRIRAQVQLFNMQAAAYPYMKQQDADRTWAELRRTAYPAADRAVKPETRADLERMAEAVGIKVIR